MPVKHIANAPFLANAFGEPYTMTERRCPPRCTGPGCRATHDDPHCELGASGCIAPSHLVRGERPLSGWLKSILVNIPRARLTMEDGVHAYACIRACNRAEDRDRGITLEARDYDWLCRVLFDDEQGKRLTAGDGKEGAGGALVIQLTDPWMAVTIQRLVCGFRDEEEEGAGSEEEDSKDGYREGRAAETVPLEA